MAKVKPTAIPQHTSHAGKYDPRMLKEGEYEQPVVHRRSRDIMPARACLASISLEYVEWGGDVLFMDFGLSDVGSGVRLF